MRRDFAGLRAARIRPGIGVRTAVAAAGVLFLAACAPIGTAAESSTATTASAPSAAAASTAASTAPPPSVATVAPTTAATTRPPVTPKAAPRPAPKPVPKPAPKPAPKPTPKPVAAPPSACDPSYPDVCLKDGIGDYDCSSGSGNGPNYVAGPVRVVGSDPFGLDANHDGFGCEKG